MVEWCVATSLSKKQKMIDTLSKEDKPQPVPIHCHDEETSDQLLPYECRVILPECCLPSQNIQCANQDDPANKLQRTSSDRVR